jgi:hypothetical protein
MLKKIVFVISMLVSLSFLASISFADINCPNCFIGRDGCSCQVSNCDTGIVDVYTSSSCVGNSIYENDFGTGSAGTFTWSPTKSGSFYGKAFCDNRVDQSGCNLIEVQANPGPTTTLKSTTTTGSEKPTCPSECCAIDDTTYKYKPCTATNQECKNRKCVSTGGGDNTLLIVGLILIIIIIGVVVYFFFIKKGKKQRISYEELYRKWK